MEKLPARIPPMLSFGAGKNAFNAYVLSKPTYSVTLRYRSPDDNWIGSPVHTTCYRVPQQDVPIQDGALGEYTSILTGSGNFPELDNLR